MTDGTERTVLVRLLLCALDGAVTNDERHALDLHRTEASGSDSADAVRLTAMADARRLASRGDARRSYRLAIEMWCAGYSAYETALALGLSTEQEAARLVKAAKAYLRRRFAAA